MGVGPSPLVLRPGFWIDRRNERGRYVLRLTGELDLHAAATLRTEISDVLMAAERPSWLELDIDRVTSVDHVGLGTLVVAGRICASMGVRLTVNPPPDTAKALETAARSATSARNPRTNAGEGRRHARVYDIA
jgi:anti-anti-sigma factor